MYPAFYVKVSTFTTSLTAKAADGRVTKIITLGHPLDSALGEKGKALDWLERAYDQCDDFLTYLKVDSRLDSLRWDGRFLDLMRRIGLAR